MQESNEAARHHRCHRQLDGKVSVNGSQGSVSTARLFPSSDSEQLSRRREEGDTTPALTSPTPRNRNRTGRGMASGPGGGGVLGRARVCLACMSDDRCRYPVSWSPSSERATTHTRRLQPIPSHPLLGTGHFYFSHSLLSPSLALSFFPRMPPLPPRSGCPHPLDMGGGGGMWPREEEQRRQSAICWLMNELTQVKSKETGVFLLLLAGQDGLVICRPKVPNALSVRPSSSVWEEHGKEDFQAEIESCPFTERALRKTMREGRADGGSRLSFGPSRRFAVVPILACGWTGIHA